MANYKRNKFKKTSKNKVNRTTVNNNITMINKKNDNDNIITEEKVKVVRGSKYRKKRLNKIFLIFASTILLCCIILSFVLPVSLYENIVNWSAILGSGNYPIGISGSTVINSISNEGYYYLLSDTNISAYSNGGKIIFDELHGFANPVISVSETRAIVYDQGGKNVFVFNLGGLIDKIETKSEILTASVSRNGFIAISTHSNEYTSAVTVYNKNMKQIYTWNSAKQFITNVLIDSSGKKLAVTTMGVNAGQYDNKFLILDINTDSADPIHKLELGASLPLALENTGKGISLVCNDKYKFVSWSDFSSSDMVVSGKINKFKNTKNGAVFTYSLANNQNDNMIVLISKTGEKTCEFNVKSNIIDIQYSSGRIYLINDSTVSIYDKSGALLKTGSCSYGIKKFAVISSDSIAAISDSNIIKTNIEKED